MNKNKKPSRSFMIRFNNAKHYEFVRNELPKINTKRRVERNIESVISCLKEAHDKIEKEGMKFK